MPSQVSQLRTLLGKEQDAVVTHLDASGLKRLFSHGIKRFQARTTSRVTWTALSLDFKVKSKVESLKPFYAILESRWTEHKAKSDPYAEGAEPSEKPSGGGGEGVEKPGPSTSAPAEGSKAKPDKESLRESMPLPLGIPTKSSQPSESKLTPAQAGEAVKNLPPFPQPPADPTDKVENQKWLGQVMARMFALQCLEMNEGFLHL